MFKKETRKTVIPWLEGTHSFFESTFGWYKSWHLKPYYVTVHIIGMILFLTSLLFFMFFDFSGKNQIEAKNTVSKNNVQAIISNKIVLKFKQTEKNKIKKDKEGFIEKNDTGISALNSKNSKYKIEKFEFVAKESKSSKKDHPVFSYASVTLPFDEILISENSKETLYDSHGFKISKDYLEKIKKDYESDPSIESADFVRVLKTLAVPNDPYYSSLWAMPKIKAPQAWDINTGTPSVTVAVVDTGIDFSHEDLTSQIWTNSGESGSGKETNGVDDDGNGYIDDWKGWDFANLDNYAYDGHGHGTHVSGTIAARANNSKGVAGVSWGAKIMPLKGLADSGSGYDSALAEAIVYAADNGAKIINNSWGGYGYSSYVHDAIEYAHDEKNVLVVAAAGNESDDASLFTPAREADAVAVSATDSSDTRAEFSNYGSKIELAAPGVSILSSIPGSEYTSASGTSMAAPHVCGLAALLWSKNPTFTNEQIRQALRASADDLGVVGKDGDFGYGRINAQRALQMTDIPIIEITSPLPLSIHDTSLTIAGTASGSSLASYRIAHRKYDTPSWVPIYSSSNQVTNGTLATWDITNVSDGWYYLQLQATDIYGRTYETIVSDIKVDNISTLVSLYFNNQPLSDPIASSTESPVELRGDAYFKYGTFSSYKIEVAKGANSNTWTTTNIVLANNGTQSVVDGVLGSWNISSLTYDTYKVRLTVYGQDGKSEYHRVEPIVDHQLIASWKNKVRGIGGVTVSDIDNNGDKEVIFYDDWYDCTAYHLCIHVYNEDGSVYSNWPKDIAPEDLDQNLVTVYGDDYPNVEDIDNDGDMEILIATRGAYWTNNPPTSYKILAYHHDGSVVSGWPAEIPWSESWTIRTNPAIGDINGDGQAEIVIKGAFGLNDNKSRLYVFKNDGTLLSGWPKLLSAWTGDYEPNPYRGSSPVLYDIDSNGTLEIFVGNQDGKMYAFRHDGTLVSGWPRGHIKTSLDLLPVTHNGFLDSTPTVGDVDNDGEPEIFGIISSIGDGDYRYGQYAYLWEKNGNLVSGWPKRIGDVWYDSNEASPVFYDMDLDGDLEIIAGSQISMYAWHHNGAEISQLTKAGYITYQNSYSVADFNNDNLLELLTVMIPYEGSLSSRIYNSKGETIWQRGTLDNLTSWAVSDIDNDEKIEILGFNQANYISAWKLSDVNYGESDPWLTYRQNSYQTGSLEAIKGVDTLANAQELRNKLDPQLNPSGKDSFAFWWDYGIRGNSQHLAWFFDDLVINDPKIRSMFWDSAVPNNWANGWYFKTLWDSAVPYKWTNSYYTKKLWDVAVPNRWAGGYYFRMFWDKFVPKGWSGGYYTKYFWNYAVPQRWTNGYYYNTLYQKAIPGNWAGGYYRNH